MNWVVYDSRGGTTRGAANSTAEHLGVESVDVKDILSGDKPFEDVERFIFFTYTDKIGGMSNQTLDFLETYSENMVGVIANGSSDFKASNAFAIAGDIISREYNVELVTKLDRGGSYDDIERIVRRTAQLFGYKKEKIAFKPDITRRVNGLLQLERM